MKRFFIISYDIEDDKKRLKAAKILLGYGNRVQKSVFEVETEQNKLDALKKRLEGCIDPKRDSVRIYPLEAPDKERITILGTGELQDDPDVYII